MSSDQSTITPSPVSSRFMRIRTISISFIMFLSFLWIVLLCVIIFEQWDLMDRIERSLILIMLLVESITVIMLPILLTREFRPWLDGARFLFLFAAHSGIAILFAARSASFRCSSNVVADQQAVCNLIILFVIIASWLVPVLVTGYSCGLALLVYRRSKLLPPIEQDIEKAKHESFYPSSRSHASTSYAVS